MQYFYKKLKKKSIQFIKKPTNNFSKNTYKFFKNYYELKNYTFCFSDSSDHILIVNFPEREKKSLLNILAFEKKISLITDASRFLVKKRKSDESSFSSSNITSEDHIEDPMQLFFEKLKYFSPCICVRVI